MWEDTVQCDLFLSCFKIEIEMVVCILVCELENAA